MVTMVTHFPFSSKSNYNSFSKNPDYRTLLSTMDLLVCIRSFYLFILHSCVLHTLTYISPLCP